VRSPTAARPRRLGRAYFPLFVEVGGSVIRVARREPGAAVALGTAT
jgi:hypothetical protein